MDYCRKQCTPQKKFKALNKFFFYLMYGIE